MFNRDLLPRFALSSGACYLAERGGISADGAIVIRLSDAFGVMVDRLTDFLLLVECILCVCDTVCVCG